MSSSAPPPAVRREIASARRDVTMPLWGDLLRPQDEVLLSRGGQGLKVYEDLERDAFVYSMVQKRKLASIARPWVVEAGGPRRADRLAAAWIEAKLKIWAFDRWWLDLADAMLKGFAVSEVMWGTDAEGRIVPTDLLSRNQRRFVFDADRRLRLLTHDNMLTGEELPERKFIAYAFGARAGDPYGKGLGHQLFWPVFFKRQGWAFWMVFAEKFGTPTVVGTYAEGTLEEEQQALLDRMTNLAQDNAIAVPSGTVLSLLEATRAGGVGTYEQLCRFCDEQIAVAVVGQTLTSSPGSSGSRALGEVHAEVQAEMVDADTDLMARLFNDTLVKWLCEFNFPDAAPPQVWRPRPLREEDEAKVRTVKVGAREAARGFVAAMRADGWEPEDPAAGLEDQAEGEWRFVGKADPAPAPLPTPSFAAPALALPAPRDAPRDALDELTDQVDQAAAPAMDAMITRIRDLVDQVEAEGGTLQDVADRLILLYPQMDSQALGQVMAQAMTTASLHGRADILAGVVG